MENPSFKLVLGFALGAIGLASVHVSIGLQLPGWRSMDFVLAQAEVEHLIGLYSQTDFANHRWLTSRIDTAFPFIYGAFFYFAAKRYAPTPWVYLLIFWVVVGMIFDFTENVAILNTLNGETEYALKTVFTRAKFVFLFIPIVYCSYQFFKDVFAGRNRKRP
jgi:hypothetical protein